MAAQKAMDEQLVAEITALHEQGFSTDEITQWLQARMRERNERAWLSTTPAHWQRREREELFWPPEPPEPPPAVRNAMREKQLHKPTLH